MFLFLCYFVRWREFPIMYCYEASCIKCLCKCRMVIWRYTYVLYGLSFKRYFLIIQLMIAVLRILLLLLYWYFRNYELTKYAVCCSSLVTFTLRALLWKPKKMCRDKNIIGGHYMSILIIFIYWTLILYDGIIIK